MNRILDWVAAAIFMAALACAGASPVALCSTDTECAALCQAGDTGCEGGPAPAFLDCNGYDCGEDH